MKYLSLIVAIVLILCLVGCGSEQSSDEAATKSSADGATETTAEVGERIETASRYGSELEVATTTLVNDAGGTIYFSKSVSTAKKKAGTTHKVTQPKSDVKVTYKSYSDMIKKAAKYTSIESVLKSGDISAEENARCSNPFFQENLAMIFIDRKLFVPTLPSGYKAADCTLSSKNFFTFNFTNSSKKKETLVVYTTADESVINSSDYEISFKNEQGIDIFKNEDGKYCWFLDEKYVAVYSGKSKDFINKVRFETVNIVPNS